jgi:hypothetical protein
MKRSNIAPGRDLLFKSMLFVIAVGLVVLFMPSESKFNYQYEIGKPWSYGQLMATFDLPIYKSDAVVKHEEDSIRASFAPYFLLDAQQQERALQQLRTKVQKGASGLSNDYLRHVERTLKGLYAKGIVNNEEKEELLRDSIRQVMAVEGNTARPLRTGDLLTVKEAYESLMQADTLHYKTERLQAANLNEYIAANLTRDKLRTEAAIQEAINSFSWAEGMVMSGQKIIGRGEVVTPEVYQVLESLRKETMKRSNTNEQRRWVLLGEVLFVGLLILSFLLYLDLFRRDYYEKKRSILLLLFLMVFYPIITYELVGHNMLSVYLIPFAMVPMIVRVFMDSRTAFIAHILTILLSSVVLRAPYEFVLLQTLAGLQAIYSLRELSERSQLMRSAVFITLTYCLTYFSYELIHEGSLSKIDYPMFINFVINGILLLFTYPLLFILEKTFGFTSNVTLVELSNINHPLLRELSETAPGTFQHSMLVANLAAAAANKIEAKSQLVRTGALYHDIGKMENPAFFTENQSGVNPHKNLSYEQSAQIVIGHVTNGLKLAEKHHLPQVIKEFISTHHGAGKTKYFYISYRNEHPDESVDEAIFTYPGPNPQTKEQAILMMADTVEAASRSLTEVTEENIGQLVDKLIDGQVAEGYFRECPITFKDIALVKGVFKEKLKIAYHTRISYPELKK